MYLTFLPCKALKMNGEGTWLNIRDIYFLEVIMWLCSGFYRAIVNDTFFGYL